MKEPKITRSRVTVSYSTDEGFRTEVVFSSRGADLTVAPHEPLLDAIDELARLCDLSGVGDQAANRVTAARARVQAWRVSQ